MKKLFTALCFGLVSGCTVMPKYVSPQSGEVAQIKYEASLWGAFPFGKRLDTQYYTGCYNSDPKLDNVLGKRMIQESGFGSENVVIPAGEKIYVSFGLPDFCKMNYSFTPEKDASYVGYYASKYAGCEGNVYKLVDGKKMPVADLEHYRLTPLEAALGTEEQWRSCKKLGSE